MNEKINIVEILKDAPKGTKLYSPLLGEVKLLKIDEGYSHPIVIYIDDDEQKIGFFCEDGRYNNNVKVQECMLFPSKNNRDWSNFNPKKKKFNPNTLQPFDRVLARDCYYNEWICSIFSHIQQKCIFRYVCVGSNWRYCIPYNDDTKHLVGTNEEAPEYYRYWED